MLRGAAVVFAKEAYDNWRDRRSVYLGLVYPLLGPLLLGALILLVGQVVIRPTATDVRMTVQGLEHAPDLAAHLESRDVIVEPPRDEPEQMVRAGKTPLVLIVPPDYQSIIDAGGTAHLRMVVDPSRLGSIVAIGRTLDLVQSFAREVTDARLRARGLDPAIADAVKIDTVNVAGSRNIAAIFLNMLPPFLIFTIFMGGVYLAIDTTAGERERGSLEPLLINPVARWELMLGKFAASLLFTIVAVVVALTAYKIMFAMVVAADVGIDANPGLGVFALVFLVALPVMAFAVALQVVVATITRSYKEVQTYLGLLPLIPSLPGMIMVFVPVTGKAWMMMVPTLGQSVLFGNLMRGDPVDPWHVVLSAVSALVAAAIILRIAARCYESEQVPFPA
jgi:sodium transport system permease protein